MRALGWLVILGLLGGSVQAATPPDKPDVARIIQGIEARYNHLTSLEADFVQRYSQGPSDVRVESGRVAFLRPGRMRWDYSTPEPKTFLSDGKFVYLYVPAEKQVTRTRAKDSPDWRTPWRFLLGRVHLKELFGRIELSTEEPRYPARYILRAFPHPGETQFGEVVLEVTGGYQLTRMLIREPGGVETEFFFLRWREDPPLAPGLFEFHVPPGVSVVE